MALKIICDICLKEATDQDFACNMRVVEILTFLTGESLSSKKTKRENDFQICKDCYYAHFNKLINVLTLQEGRG